MEAQMEGIALPHPQEIQVRAQNAERIARRRAVSALADSVAQTDASSLSRRSTQREIGGTFESLQEVPEREAPANTGVSTQDFASFLAALSFAPSNEVLTSSSSLSSFFPFFGGLNDEA